MELLSERGVAVFLPLSDADGELRTANKKAVLAGKPFVPYLITKEILYYRDFLLEQLIQHEEQLVQQPMLYEHGSGQNAGRIRCVALRSSESQEGILLHYHKEGWQYACLPAITAQEAALEGFCAAQLQ